MEAAHKIRRLTEVVINQINAGEVIERPANVVKELIENSLDAGASHIEVSLKEGGMREIFVKDNGSGIRPADLALAVERYTTSKIERLDDLLSCSSYGFRGEALASIASVSKMVLRSSTESSEGGAEIEIDFGEPSQPVPAARAQGTSVWVKDLFDRVPARKKYLRSIQTELAYIAKVVKEAALSHPQVQFQFYHQGELLHAYPVNDQKGRFWTCLKPQWEPVEFIEEGFELALHAFLSPPIFSNQRNEFYFYINRRPIRNRTLMAAVRNAYLDLLGKGYEPTGVVFLKVGLDRVDVNAHPQKLEVRCLQQEKIYSWIYQTVKKHLSLVENRIVKEESEGSRVDPKGRCVARLSNRYLVYVDSEGISVLDSKSSRPHGRVEKYRLGLSEIEKIFNS